MVSRSLENIRIEEKGLWTAMHGWTFEGTCNDDQCNFGLPGENLAAMIPAWSAMGAHGDWRAPKKTTGKQNQDGQKAQRHC